VRLLKDPRSSDYQRADAIKRANPASWKHVNLYGAYSFLDIGDGVDLQELVNLLDVACGRGAGMVFDRVTLVSSVLPREYEWDKRFTLGQVERVTNHRSAFDVPVAILCNLLRALGMRDVGTAGFDGFDQRRPEIEEVYYYNGGHGKPLEKDNLKHFIEHTLSGEAHYPNARKDRAPGKLLSRLSGSAVVGLAVAGALLVAFGLLIWLLASLLGILLPWRPALVWLFAALVVGVTSYLFSRYY
jgi:hypothetical protein